ncbi:MAG: FAD-dependent oxidoreductase [Desulfobacterales bacterium]
MKRESHSYDAVIIGAGIGGLITGAILATKEDWKILVLEQSDVIGGKCYSFEHFDGDEDTFRNRLLLNARSRLLQSNPPLDHLIKTKTFSSYIFEGGYHAIQGGDRSRVSFISAALGADLPVHNSRGVRIYGNGKWNDLRYLMRNWTPDEFKEGNRISREMALMSPQEAACYDHIDLSSYIRSKTRSKNIQAFHEWVAAYSVGLNDPGMVSAGEYIRAGLIIQCAGRRFDNGGAGQPVGGYNAMTRLFARLIEEKGGLIKTGAPVVEILARDYVAVGVRTADDDYLSKLIICNVPVQRALTLLPDDHWPEEHRKQVETKQPLAGIHGWINVKKQLDPEFEGFYIVPPLPGCRASDGFRGDVTCAFEDLATHDKNRAPDGEGLIAFFAGLLPRNPDEIHNKELQNKIINGLFSFFREECPDFDKNVNWYTILAGEEFYSVSTTPGMIGDRFLPIKHPLVKNLFFTGDSVESWGLGINFAAGSAVRCASAASGKNYSTILPFYMR